MTKRKRNAKRTKSAAAKHREEINFLIRGAENQLRALESDLKHPRLIENQLNEIDKQITALQAKRERLIERKRNLPELIAAKKQQIAELKKKREKENPVLESLQRTMSQFKLLAEELGIDYEQVLRGGVDNGGVDNGGG